MFAAGDWALKRILKFVLKRSLRHIIKTQIDLDQLNVQLGQGTLELREVLLNTDYLNQQLSEVPWEITAAFVGSVAAVLPLSALYSDSCVVKLDEVFLTLRPRTVAAPTAAGQEQGPPGGVPPPPAPAAFPAADWAGAATGGDSGESAVSEGVRLIAGGLEALLQRMRVAATRVVLRLEIPDPVSGSTSQFSGSGEGQAAVGGCHVVTVGLGEVEYYGRNLGSGAGEGEGEEGQGGACGPAGSAAAAAVQVAKSLRFSALTLELQPAAPKQQQAPGQQAPAPPPCSLLGSADGVGGCGGTVDVCLTWGLRPHSRPHISLSAQLDPVSVQLSSGDILALAAVAAAARQLPTAASRPPSTCTTAAPAGSSSAMLLAAEQMHHLGSRSLIEGLMLPDCEGMVLEALQQEEEQEQQAGGGGMGAAGVGSRAAGAPRSERGSFTGQEEVDEFFDAKSLLGSLQSSYASFMSAYGSMYAGTASAMQSLYGAPPPESSPAALGASLCQAHDLAASVRQMSGEEPLEWEVTVATEALNLALLYPTPAALPPNSPGGSSSSSACSSPGRQGACGSAGGYLGYAPRLALELSGVAAAAAGGAGGVECSVCLRQVEAAEHLVVAQPQQQQQQQQQGSGAGEGEEAPPEEVARVPCVLPPLGFAPRPLPSGAGLYPLPSVGLGATLCQLSDLQASMYQSAMQASVFADSRAAPRLLILPVLCCGGAGTAGGSGGSSQGAPDVCTLVHVALSPTAGNITADQQQQQQQKGDGGVNVTLALQPLCLWVSVPLLERLQAFLEPIQAGMAAAAATTASSSKSQQGTAGTMGGVGADQGSAQQGQQSPPAGGAKAAVSAAIQDILQDLRHLRVTDTSQAAAPSGGGAMRLRIYLPHVCLVAFMPRTPMPPASTSHGYSYVAADLSMGLQHGALMVQGLRRLKQSARLCDVQALVHQLSSSSVTPSLLLQLGHAAVHGMRSSHWGAGSSVGTWDCSLTAAAAAAYLVGGIDCTGGGSVLGSCLYAHQVCSVPPPAGCAVPGVSEAAEPAQGLVLEVQWSPDQAASPGLLQDSWQRLGSSLQPSQEPSEEQGRWESDGLDVFTFRQQCIQTSPLYLRVVVPALAASLSPAALAALANFADGLLALAPQPPADQRNGSPRAGGSGVQVAVEVECAASCRLLSALTPWHSPPADNAAELLFSIDTAGMQLLSVGNLCGVSGGGATVLSCDAVTLLSGGAGGGGQAGTVLLHRPAGATVDGRAVPGVELVHIARPQGSPSRLHPRTKRYYIPTDARVAVSLAGWTLATEGGDLSLSWLRRFAAFFSLGPSPSAPAPPSPSAQLATPGQHSQPEPALCLEWALQADSLALRYEPPCQVAYCPAEDSAREPVAAAVVVGSASCCGASMGRPVPAPLPLSLRCLAVHIAPAGSRTGHWSPCTPQHAVGPALSEAGYCCIATEGEFSISIPLPQEGAVASSDATAGGPAWHLEASNHLLSVTLTQQSTLLLQQLAQQCAKAAEQQRAQRQSQFSANEQQAGSSASVAGPAAGQAHTGAAKAASRSRSSSSARQPSRSLSQQEQQQQQQGSRRSVDVLQGVRDDAYRSVPAQQGERPRQASVFIDGGWFEALSNEPLSPAGSPPVLIDDFFGAQAPGGPGAVQARLGALADSEAQEGNGTWFDPLPAAEGASSSPDQWGELASSLAQPPRELPAGLVREDYMDSKPAEEPPSVPMAGQCALGSLPAGYPASLARISLRDINLGVTLASAPLEEADAAASAAAAAAGPTELQLNARRLCVQVDTFPQQGHRAFRLAASLHTLEIKKHMGAARTTPTPAAASSSAGHLPASTRSGSSSAGTSPGKLRTLQHSQEWRELLGYHAALGRSRGPEACMVAVMVEAVRPDLEEGGGLPVGAAGTPAGGAAAAAAAAGQEEYRVEVHLLPLRLQLDQGTVAFLQRFFAPFGDTLAEPAVVVEYADAEEDEEAAAAHTGLPAGGLAEPALGSSQSFIQRCEVQPFSITIDYQPHSVDIAALRRGDLMEILNLFPWGGVTLQFRRLRLFGVNDAATLGTMLASAWLEDIIKFQAHKFLAGIAPIRSLCKVSSAAMQLIAIPVEHLFAESSGPANHRALSSLADANFLRQMRRGMLALVRAIAAEALGLGATVAGGAQMALKRTSPQGL